ncbi:MAG TPA: hypothetical protein VH062_18065 [Polyangiaceae bacterium]|jgi:hypothetical protein|nr:hypothetical protein [Polyangiaceae bacterium]
MNWRAPEERAPRRPKPPTGPKIIVQYRARGGKVYEIQSAEAVVAVHISESETETAKWRVGAQSAGVPPMIEARASTAAEALKDVASAWKSHVPALTVFDWEAITRELSLVQAL